jgi:uncharacterized damage-inducible protein DinB
MEEIKRIDEQLRRAFEGPAWHGPSLHELLADITAEQAAARPLTGAHSIWELVLHVTAAKDLVRRRLAGEHAELSSEEDWPAVTATGEAAWQESLASLRRAQTELQHTMAHVVDSGLEGTVPRKDHSVYIMLHGLIQHDLYHAGQIALLKNAWK